MNAQLQVEEPDDIIFTASFTMSLKDWKLLKVQLNTGWPACDLAAHIRSMISQAERTYYPEAAESGEGK